MSLIKRIRRWLFDRWRNDPYNSATLQATQGMVDNYIAEGGRAFGNYLCMTCGAREKKHECYPKHLREK